MRVGEKIKSSIRMPQDSNGAAVPAPYWGKTIEVPAGSNFIAETGLMRIVTGGMAFLQLNVEGAVIPGDLGIPIIMYESSWISCFEGDIFTITGAPVYVTFCRDLSSPAMS